MARDSAARQRLTSETEEASPPTKVMRGTPVKPIPLETLVDYINGYWASRGFFANARVVRDLTGDRVIKTDLINGCPPGFWRC